MTKVNFKQISVHKTPKTSPGLLLWQVSTSWRSSIERTLKSMDLTHPQFVVLATLGWLTRNGDRITQAEIGKMAHLDPNTLSQIIKGLEKKKLVQRADSSDKRVKSPFLTANGKKLLKKALPTVEATDEQFFALLKKNEKTALLKIFQKLADLT